MIDACLHVDSGKATKPKPEVSPSSKQAESEAVRFSFAQPTEEERAAAAQRSTKLVSPRFTVSPSNRVPPLNCNF